MKLEIQFEIQRDGNFHARNVKNSVKKILNVFRKRQGQYPCEQLTNFLMIFSNINFPTSRFPNYSCQRQISLCRMSIPGRQVGTISKTLFNRPTLREPFKIVPPCCTPLRSVQKIIDNLNFETKFKYDSYFMTLI